MNSAVRLWVPKNLGRADGGGTIEGKARQCIAGIALIMMESVYLVVTIFLLLTLGGALWRTIRGPSAADRLMTAQLFGTTGVAMLLLLAEALDMPALRDVALVFALLAILVVLTFVRNSRSQSGDDPENES